MHVSDAHLDEVRTRGFTVVENFLEPDLLAAAWQALFQMFPSPEAYFADPERHAALVATQFSGLKLFPYPSNALNHLSVHPDLVDAARRLCATDDLHLYKIELWAKYSGAVNYDQAHHRDYSNHSLVVPRADDDFMQVTTFLLLSDVTEADGPTKVVPLDRTRDVPLTPWFVPMGAHADEEVAITGPAGSLFIYRTDVLHRGSAMTGSNRARFVLLTDFQPRGRPWTGKMAWPDRANSRLWSMALAPMTPAQRELFGFPKIGDPYWDEQTIRDVAARYPGMDMTPYQNGLSKTAA
ncbi:phytanoyl-CoA dioxygenase family protein [Sandaracinobacteroides saxicola]|uniref:Phytanoyl-CoA dioxygenase family protein n=1 Tax=Sandaracinobacteroides saxicola TaxID=2759707 RepID=A0A7G5IGB7_9SPHN|nr:phytanoyl-CoA dioxygenase family protein [Sandaracinobacteroides saxicola]QMW22409.1 phytanoyl-CoA dioxygenase family protein [Sandaracinobacteroides saxicola]